MRQRSHVFKIVATPLRTIRFRQTALLSQIAAVSFLQLRTEKLAVSTPNSFSIKALFSLFCSEIFNLQADTFERTIRKSDLRFMARF